MWDILDVYSGKLFKSDKTTRLLAKVQCSCGKVEVRRLDHVKSGRTKECKSCSSKRTASIYPLPVPEYKGIEGFSKTHFNSFEVGARRRGLEFSITIQDAWEQWRKQEGLCALSGVKLILEAPLKNQAVDYNVITASLDRVNSSLGYTKENIQWVHKELNFMKSNTSDIDFINWCKLIAEYRKDK